jgi:glycosyltransferase involved in cell wall biosynthesis
MKEKILVLMPAQAALNKQRTGVEEYLYQLLKEWSKKRPKGVKFLLYFKRKPFRASRLLNQDFFQIKIIRSPYLWTIARLSLEILKIKLQRIFWRNFSVDFQRKFGDFVLFIPAHVMPLIHPRRTVVTIHGLEYEYFPEYYSWFSRKYLRWSTRYATKHAWKIIAVSRNTKRDLVKLYKADPGKISVIWHGIEKNHESRIKNHDSKFIIPNSRYFLYLGRIELKKNVLGIIKAFEKFKIQTFPPRFSRETGRFFNSKFKDYKLILAGGKGYGYKNLKFKIQNSKFRKDIIFTGYVSSKEKWQLLRNAEAFVFPSYYEGFGMPILEAQSVRTPVITSRGSSMEEIVTMNHESRIKNHDSKFIILDSSSALLVDPHNPQEIADAMYKIVSNKKLCDGLVKKGHKNVKRFSWKKCAEKTLEILNSQF